MTRSIPTMEGVLKAVCSASHLSRAQIMTKTRRRHIARPRQVAAFLMRRHVSNASHVKISAFFGMGGHDWSIHCSEKIESLLCDPYVARLVTNSEAIFFGMHAGTLGIRCRPYVISEETRRLLALARRGIYPCTQCSRMFRNFRADTTKCDGCRTTAHLEAAE